MDTYISKKETNTAFHPELQAELTFGMSELGTAEEMLDNLKVFYARGEAWKSADNEIRVLARGRPSKPTLPALDHSCSRKP